MHIVPPQFGNQGGSQNLDIQTSLPQPLNHLTAADLVTAHHLGRKKIGDYNDFYGTLRIQNYKKVVSLAPNYAWKIFSETSGLTLDSTKDCGLSKKSVLPIRLLVLFFVIPHAFIKADSKQIKNHLEPVSDDTHTRSFLAPQNNRQFFYIIVPLE
jgi:hypothetical protein